MGGWVEETYLNHQSFELRRNVVSDSGADQPGKEAFGIRGFETREVSHTLLGDGFVQVDKGGFRLLWERWVGGWDVPGGYRRA